MILLGVKPNGPETEYGWLEPGERVGSTGSGPIYRIRRFREKPSPEVAQDCSHRLARPAFWGSEHERWALDHAYVLAPTVNFSESILEACSLPRAVLRRQGQLDALLASEYAPG